VDKIKYIYSSFPHDAARQILLKSVDVSQSY